MSDPHVVSLEYKLETDDSTSYRDPPPVEIASETFLLRLADGVLTVTLNQHFHSAEAARAAVDPFLWAWELDVALRRGPGELQFVFKDAVVIDRDPPQSGQRYLHPLSGRISGSSRISATLHVTRGKYPEPPSLFRITPEVETLWHRYQGYREGREPLLPMAYFCYTLLQARAGGRQQAGLKYSISDDVLRKLGELTSTRGDFASARKLTPQSTLKPVTEREEAWIEYTVKALIYRVGERESSDSLPLLTMSDLPPL